MLMFIAIIIFKFINIILMRFTLIKQWFNTSVIKITYNNEEIYCINYVIDNKLCKMFVAPNNEIPKSITDEKYNDCYIDRLISYFRYKEIPFNSLYIMDKKLIIHK